jgi:predicted outer membrane repeat protein
MIPRTQRSLIVTVATLSSALLLAPGATSATLHVPSEYISITLAMQAASYGDTVEVACGVYKEHDIVVKNGVTLRSATSDPSCVAVDAGGHGRVFWCSGVDATTRVEGIRIRGGYTSGYAVGSWGAGMLCVSGAGLVVENCIFEDNMADLSWGGGFACSESSPTVRGCAFRRNQSISYTMAQTSRGGAVVAKSSEAVFDVCTFENNSSTESGGAIYAESSDLTIRSNEFNSNHVDELFGGAIHCALSSPSITDCIFQENTADRGGGLACTLGSSPTVSGCVFVDNAASYKAGGMWCDDSVTSPSITDSRFEGNTANYGGAVYVMNQANVTFERCVFLANWATGYGGAMEFNSATGLVRNCTFVMNGSTYSGGTIDSRSSDPLIESCIFSYGLPGRVIGCGIPGAIIRCCDFFGNQSGEWLGCLEGLEGVDGNFSADPRFCDLSAGDFTLQASSPCLPGQHPAGEECGQIGALGAACAATSVEEAGDRASWGTVKVRFR